jgi:hypothetical protein
MQISAMASGVDASGTAHFSPEPGLVGGCARDDREFAQLSDGRTRNGDREIQPPSPGRDVFPALGHHLDVCGQQASRLLVARRQVRCPADADRGPPFLIPRGAGHDQVVNRAYRTSLEPH